VATYLVNEIYPCLQGEGVNLGKPSILIRFQICNLRCVWCDTPYTHTYESDPKKDELHENELNEKEASKARSKRAQNYKRYDLLELTKAITSSHPTITHLILSGGEPTLQNLALLKKSLPPFYTAEVESNGTIIPHLKHKGFEEKDYGLFQWNISPKGQNAQEVYDKEALSHWATLVHTHPNVYFKFVIRKTKSLEDVKEALGFQEAFQVPKDRMLLMPEGVTVESQQDAIWLHDICLKEGIRYSPRLHVILFGSQRGV
jgi:7-carboxy-7-deazaguanine synthase